jgi:hypothetical protein
MGPTRRPSARKATRLPKPPKGPARRRNGGNFPIGTTIPPDPNAVPNGGRLGVNIASTFGNSQNRSVWEDLDFRSKRHPDASFRRRTPCQTQMARPSRHARFRRNRRPIARPHALWSRTFRPRVRQNPA